MSEASQQLVYFQCFKVDSKLRVRMISDGYNKEANCQFPRAIRVESAKYSAPISDLSFSETRGKFFYRVKKNNIKVISRVDELSNILVETKISVTKVYECDDSNCIICMDEEYDVVLVPCGHYCLCKGCSSQISKCPLCRQKITMAVTRDRIQM